MGGAAVAVMRAEVGGGERATARPPLRRAARPPARPPTRLPANQTLPGRTPAAPIVTAPAIQPSPNLGLPAWAMQTALKISMPADPAEREAATIGAHVARLTEPPALRPGGGALGGAPALRVQRQVTPTLGQSLPPAGHEATNPTTASRITSQVGGGDPLAQPVRRLMERRLAANFAPVRIHTNARANQLAKDLGAHAFTVGADIFFAPGEYQPDSPRGQELLAHELVHTIQQGAVIQDVPGAAAATLQSAGVPTAIGAAAVTARSTETTVQRSADAAVTVRQRAGGQVQRSVVSKALDWFADKANLIPGFRMFTIIIGLNPINMSRVEPSAANILRALVEFIPGGGLIVQALDKYGVFDKAGAAVEREINALGISGAMIRNAVMEFVNGLGPSDVFHLGDVWERAKRIFTDPIGRIIRLAVNLGLTILRLVRDAILAPLAKLAEGTRGYDLLKAVLGKDPITGAAAPRTAETLIGGFMKLIGQEEIWNNLQKSKAVPRAWAWFQGALQGLLGFVRQIPQLFISALQTLEWTDIVLLPRAFLKVASVFGGFIGQFLSWAGNAMWNLLQIILEVVAPGAIPYLKKVGAAFRKIIQNPLPFVGNLVKAARLGFEMFRDRFLTHLKAGLLNWLTGSLPGVYIPKAFTLLEFGKFALSVFGISWAQIRAKIVKAIGSGGEAIMRTLETTFDVVVALVKGGPAAAWDVIKDKLTNLKDQIVDGIVSFVTETIITKAVPKLIAMFIPGAGFISALISIYDTIMVFVQKIRQIIQVVTAFLDGLMAIAAGNIQPAAKKVESVLANLLSLAISFLAGFLGLGKVADKIMGVINKVRATVDKALDTAINFVIGKAKALFAGLFTVGVPQDPRERLRLATQAAVAATQRFSGRLTRVVLTPILAGIKARYGLTELVPYEQGGEWWVRATINPTTNAKLGSTSGQEQPAGGGTLTAANRQMAIQQLAQITAPIQVSQALADLNEDEPGILNRYKGAEDGYLRYLQGKNNGETFDWPLAYLRRRAALKKGKAIEAFWIRKVLGTGKNNASFQVREQSTWNVVIPDILTDSVVGDAKDWKDISFTVQLRAFHMIAKARNNPGRVKDAAGNAVTWLKSFVLIVRSKSHSEGETNVSGPLRAAVDRIYRRTTDKDVK